jgi:hypothetical protein
MAQSTIVGQEIAGVKMLKSSDPMVVQLTVSELRALVSEAVATALAERSEAGPGADSPALLTQHALADTLGTTTRTVFNLRRRGLPVVWLSESPRFELPAVLAWLRSREPEAEADAEATAAE